MSSIPKEINTITMYSGYDRGGVLHEQYIYFTNGIVVPDEDITNVTMSIMVIPYNNVGDSLDVSSEHTLDELYFTTNTPADGFAFGNLDTGYQNGVFNGIASLSLFRQNRGKTVYLGGLVSDLYNGSGELDYFTVAGSINFTIVEAVVSYTFTISPDPQDATVTIDGIPIDNVTVPSGTTITYIVSKEGYYDEGASVVVTKDEIKTVSLTPIRPTVTIIPTPSASTVYMNGYETKELTVSYGGSINYEVSHPGYITETGTISNIKEDKTQTIGLQMDTTPWTFAVVVEPVEAYIVVTTTNRGTVESQYKVAALTVETYGYENIEWYVECPGYLPQSGSLTAYEDTTKNVKLVRDEEQPTHLFEIVTNVTNPTIYIQGEQTWYYMAQEGEVVTYSASAEGYVTEDGEQTYSGRYTMGTSNHTLTLEFVEALEEETLRGIKVGEDTVVSIKLGTSNIVAAYLGDTLLWGTSSEPTLPEENQRTVAATTGSIGIAIDGGEGMVTVYKGSGTTYIPSGYSNVTISGLYNDVSYDSWTGEVTYNLYGSESNAKVYATISWS